MRDRLEPLLTTYVWLVYTFMYAPILLMGLFSLNSSELMTFPLEHFTLRWYGETLTDARILAGLGTTFLIALPVTILTLSWARPPPWPWSATTFPQAALPGAPLPALLPAPDRLRHRRGHVPGRDRHEPQPPHRLDRPVADHPPLHHRDRGLGPASTRAWRRPPPTSAPPAGRPSASSPCRSCATACWPPPSWPSCCPRPNTPSRPSPAAASSLSVLVASDFRFHLSPKLNALAMLIVAFNVLVIVASELVRRGRPTMQKA